MYQSALGTEDGQDSRTANAPPNRQMRALNLD
jgi:hypothetical protein